MKYPFEATLEELNADVDNFVNSVFATLESEFLILPRGEGFIDYSTFEEAYQTLRLDTEGFAKVDSLRLLSATEKKPLCLIVLRTILGLTPPEWAYMATQRTDVSVSQAYARTLDRKIRKDPEGSLPPNRDRIKALVEAACQLLTTDVPEVGRGQIHRLEKVDTREGAQSLYQLSQTGVPYAMLLYERFLGRPFASHRDSVSELIGGGLESAIEDLLAASGIPYRKTKRAEKITGFDQAPDFTVPDEHAPRIVIEAKVTEDDGTARDKVTRIQHLDALSRQGVSGGHRRFQVIACIAGRGFGVRREDMKKLLFATDGKVFTLKNLSRIVACSDLVRFAVQPTS